jgi:hypothetical protein
LTPPSKTENTQSAPHNIDLDVTTPVLPSTQPTNELPSPARPQRATQLPSRYTNFVPSSDIVNQLLAIDNDELTIPLPDGPNSAANIVSHIMAADLILDEANNINADDDNPPTVRLVAKGFTQIFGQDFTFTFAPVASVATVKTSTFEKCVITGAINYVKS